MAYSDTRIVIGGLAHVPIIIFIANFIKGKFGIKTGLGKDTFVKEVDWKPNSTFNFCGQDNKTWHSYNSTAESNRITLNFFIKQKYKTKEYFLD